MFFSNSFFNWLHQFPELSHLKLYVMAWIPLKVGMVLLIFSILIFIEAYWLKNLKPNLFLKLGQNTLTIFILHMFVLYGPALPVSIKKYFNHKIDSTWILPSAFFFVIIFAIIIYVIDRYRDKIHNLLRPIRTRTNVFFGIKD